MEAGKNGDNGWITAKGGVAVGRGWVLITGEVRGGCEVRQLVMAENK